MDSVSSIGRSPENCCSRPAGTKPATAQATAVNLSQSRSSDITLVTAEGDTVTLSSSRTTEVSFATYSSKGQSSESAGASAEVRTSSEFSLTVDGDLNREELKDIRKAIKTLWKAERDLLKGHEERAAERTEKLAKLDQIASIDARMEFSQAISVTQSSVEVAAPEEQASVETALPETIEPSEATPESAPTPATSTPIAVQHFALAAFEQRQQFTFQYLWDAGRPIAIQSPSVSS